jgi:uncharacterized SAM-binding protein YcdF (DUF218 family)
MFFFLSKLLDIAVDPLWWGVAPLLLGLRLAVSDARRRLGLTLATVGVCVLALFSTPLVANRLWASLEAGAENTSRADVTYDAVVLLGGVVSPAGSLRESPAWNDNVERLLETHRLVTTGRAKVAIVSGGSLGNGLDTEAGYLAAELVRLGVPKEAVIVEDKANNTRENATESRKILEQLGAKQVLLVTSAFHMPRSVGCFRAAGVVADTLPVDYRMRHFDADQHWLPRAEYLGQSARALREWLGRLVYRVMGYTK